MWISSFVVGFPPHRFQFVDAFFRTARVGRFRIDTGASCVDVIRVGLRSHGIESLLTIDGSNRKCSECLGFYSKRIIIESTALYASGIGIVGLFAM